VRRLRLIVIVVFVVGILAGAGLLAWSLLKPKTAGIYVETSPASSVFIDGEQVGRTPYDATRGAAEVVVKLVPETVDKPLSPYEVKVTLTPGIKTIIKREFADSEETSAGEIVSFEKMGGDEASVSVVSIPDAAQVAIDGQIRGFAPYKASSITPGEHSLVVSYEGYASRTITIKAIEGHRLTAVVKLKPTGEVEAEKTEEPQKEEEKKMMVEILSTPTGFLRVRAEPSTAAEEVSRVDPGEKFTFIEENETKDWYKIEYEKGKEGWVSSQYAKKLEVTGTPTGKVTPTPTSKLTPTPAAKPSPTPTAKPTTSTPVP
jgi:uncharacterized protein YgiM (DUF1202 family)